MSEQRTGKFSVPLDIAKNQYGTLKYREYMAVADDEDNGNVAVVAERLTGLGTKEKPTNNAGKP